MNGRKRTLKSHKGGSKTVKRLSGPLQLRLRGRLTSHAMRRVSAVIRVLVAVELYREFTSTFRRSSRLCKIEWAFC